MLAPGTFRKDEVPSVPKLSAVFHHASCFLKVAVAILAVMKTNPLLAAAIVALCKTAVAHDGPHDAPFSESERAAIMARYTSAGGGGIMLAQATAPRATAEPRASAPAQKRPAQADAFSAFAPKVAVRWDEKVLFIESNGLPSHNMMVGITAWQQQVPLPQNYTGANAWQIPLSPVPAKTPASIRDRFLRGAIAIAANGIPIFNPQNNRGEISADIGELDEWGGHCGRADDYHYHAAPLHLQKVLGPKLPIAYALDGYPIYGLTEPDGTAPTGLDAFNGHSTPALGYHYHASKKYPFVNGGFHGEVVEAGGQVDPQPRANPVRPALQALRGAKITGFERMPANGGKLTYEVSGDKRAVVFSVNSDGTHPFEFQNGREGMVKEIYTARTDGAGRSGGGAERRRTDREERPRQTPASAPQRTGGFTLRSPVVQEGGDLPKEFTGDGEGVTPPLEWTGAPAGTKGFALIMSHIPGPGEVKWYWTLYDIPATTTSLAKGGTGGGKLGTGFKGQIGYEPPHSKGPGRKTYTLTLYALSDSPKLAVPPAQANRETLLAAIKDITLATAELNVAYSRGGETTTEPSQPRETAPAQRDGQQGARPPRPEVAALDSNSDGTIDAAELANATQSLRKLDSNGDGKLSDEELRPQRSDGAPPQPPATAPSTPAEQPRGERRPQGGGKGGADNKGLIKPSIADTMKLNVYADNWFILYVNGRLVAVDPIQFTPHNVVSVDFLPEYPMTIAVMAKDNADPKTGMEYGTNIGDGGFILKFGDGTVTNASWKAKSFFKGPLNHDTANPKVEHTPIPEKWWAVDFDDSKWANAKEYAEEQVNPKQPYFEADFKGAKFIWTEDIDLDNTVIFRTKIERPDWKQRWNTKPDLDVSGAPLR